MKTPGSLLFKLICATLTLSVTCSIFAGSGASGKSPDGSATSEGSPCRELYRKGRYNFYRKDYEKASQLFARGLAAAGRSAKSTECRANCLAGLGEISFRRQDYPKALKFLKGALKLYEESLWTEHPYCLHCKRLIAQALMNTGRAHDAAVLMEQVVATDKLAYAQGDQRLFDDLDLLATCYEQSGNYESACKALKRILALRSKTKSEDKSALLATRVRLCELSVKMQHWDQLPARLKPLLEWIDTCDTQQKRSIATALYWHGKNLCERKEYEPAGAACRQSLELFQSLPDPGKTLSAASDDIHCLTNYTVLGTSLIGLERFDEAANAFDRAQALQRSFKTKYGPEQQALARGIIRALATSLYWRAEELLEKKNYAESVRFAKKGLHILSELPKPDKRELAVGIDNHSIALRDVLARAYQAQGHPDAATRQFRQVVGLSKEFINNYPGDRQMIEERLIHAKKMLSEIAQHRK